MIRDNDIDRELLSSDLDRLGRREDLDSTYEARRRSRRVYITGLAMAIAVTLALVILFAVHLRKDSTSKSGSVPIMTYEKVATQFSLRDAFLAGVYEGNVTVREMKGYGTSGYAVLNRVEGHVLLLDNVAYTVGFDGKVRLADDDAVIAFGIVTTTLPYALGTLRISQGSPMSLQGLRYVANNSTSTFAAFVDRTFVSTVNHLYAVRLTGTFNVTTMSFPPQQIPYQPFLECVAPHTKLTKVAGVQGTILCFRGPPFSPSLWDIGYSCGFISNDRKVAGRLAAFEIVNNAKIGITDLPQQRVVLPERSPLFDAARLPYIINPHAVCHQ